MVVATMFTRVWVSDLKLQGVPPMSLRASSLAVFVSLFLHFVDPPAEQAGYSSDASMMAASEVQRSMHVCRLDSFADPDGDEHLTTVRNVVGRLLSVGTPTTSQVEDALLAVFDDVATSAFDQDYVWMFDPFAEEWDWVCLGTTTFEIEPVRDANPVQVIVKDRVVLD